MKLPDSRLTEALLATGLPVASDLPAICEFLVKTGILVLQAEPGAGKTSLVPLALANHPVLGKGKIIVLEPRRIAAVSAASRASELLQEKPGARAGYRVRYESAISADTRIEFITEALLPSMILASPGLPEVSTVILDEFHERSVHADLALALALDCRELNPSLRILLMSATIDAADIAQKLGAAMLRVPGRTFPVETSYQPMVDSARSGNDKTVFRDSNAGFFAGGISAMLAKHDGDLLAFLPGMAEINRTRAALTSLDSRSDIITLHGSMGLNEQRQALNPEAGSRRRVILATSIAETSLTVPRVTMVADAGLARGSAYDARTGMDRLHTGFVSRAQADQRRGRAGRLGKGSCVRFWSEGEYLLDAARPQILSSEISQLVLQLSAWGVIRGDGIHWLDAPPESAWQSAQGLLRMLTLIDGDGKINDRGLRVLKTGLHPRLGSLVRRGVETSQGQAAAFMAAVIGEQISESDKTVDETAGAILSALKQGRGDDDSRRVEREFRRICSQSGISPGLGGLQLPSGGALLASAYPDRIARRVSGTLFTFANNRNAASKNNFDGTEWIVATDADAGEMVGRIFSASIIQAEDVREALAPLTEKLITVEWRGWKPAVTERTAAGAFLFGEKRLAPAAHAQLILAALSARLASEGFACLPVSEQTANLVSRLGYFYRHTPGAADDMPGPQSPVLAREASLWLLPFVTVESSGLRAELLTADIVLQALLYRYSRWKTRLDAACPEYFITPAGSSRKIVYPEDSDAFLELKIQELFGTTSSPTACEKPLVLKLLSPAGRPLQVTSDLGSFWRGAYREIRNPLKARYPKHYWPEDPLQAEPTKGLKPRR